MRPRALNRLRRLSVAVAGTLAFVPIGSADAGERNEATVLMSTNERQRADQEAYGYASAVVAGDTIYLSGIVAGRAPGETDLEPAYERVFRQAETILKRAGASLDDVVDMTSFHTDITAEIGPMSTVSKRLLKGPPPAWTAVDIDRLLPDGGITEIKIVARRPQGAKSE